jgi:hypothetical protein
MSLFVCMLNLLYTTRRYTARLVNISLSSCPKHKNKSLKFLNQLWIVRYLDILIERREDFYGQFVCFLSYPNKFVTTMTKPLLILHLLLLQRLLRLLCVKL